MYVALVSKVCEWILVILLVSAFLPRVNVWLMKLADLCFGETGCLRSLIVLVIGFGLIVSSLEPLLSLLMTSSVYVVKAGVEVVQPRKPEPWFVDWYQDFLELLDYRLLALACVAMLGLIVGFWLLRGVYRMTRYALRRMRGITYIHESVREGSGFYKVKSLATGQVMILRAGFGTDQHVGFGIRVNDVLIMPKHVYEDAQPDMLLAGFDGQGKVMKISVCVRPIDSKIVRDVVYLALSEEIFKRIGVKSAHLGSRKNGFGQASVVGLDQSGLFSGYKFMATTGALAKTAYLGLISYSGSTVPGMSGAPYEEVGVCLGMHTGASITENIGVSSEVFVAELKTLLVAEKKRAGMVRMVNPAADYDLGGEVAAANQTRTIDAVWNSSDIDDVLRRVQNSTWAQDFDEECLGESAVLEPATSHGEGHVDKALRFLGNLRTDQVEGLVKALELKKKVISNQSIEGGKEIVHHICDTRHGMVMNKLKGLDGRVRTLEKKQEPEQKKLEVVSESSKNGERPRPMPRKNPPLSLMFARQLLRLKKQSSWTEEEKTILSDVGFDYKTRRYPYLVYVRILNSLALRNGFGLRIKNRNVEIGK